MLECYETTDGKDSQPFTKAFHIQSLQYIIKNNINFKMTTADLGIKVLATIQNLISEIDRPAHQSLNRRVENKQSLGEIQEEFDKYKVYSKMSYNFRKKNTDVNTILKDRVYQDQKQYQKFKVTNRTTIKILQNKNIKPIHERAHEIVAKKNFFIRYQQQQLQQQQKESMRPMNSSIDDLAGRKYNENDLQQYRCEIDERNKERIKRRNMSKLHLVKKQELKIPNVNTFSRSLSSKRNVKKNYSENVFQRMMQDNFERNTKKIQLMQARQKQEGNFEPVLCSKSIFIAQKLKKYGQKQQHSFHHHSHCQLHSPKIDKTPIKVKIKQIKKQIKKQKLDNVKEKSANKINNKQQTKSPNRLDKSLSHSICKRQTVLKQKKLNSNASLTIKPKQTLAKQKSIDKNKQNKKLPITKAKQCERKK